MIKFSTKIRSVKLKKKIFNVNYEKLISNFVLFRIIKVRNFNFLIEKIKRLENKYQSIFMQ